MFRVANRRPAWEDLILAKIDKERARERFFSQKRTRPKRHPLERPYKEEEKHELDT